MRGKNVLRVLSIIATLVVATMAIGPASATGTLFVNPPSIVDETKIPGTPPFTITVEIDAGVTNVWGFEFRLFYDTSILTATASITGPPGGPEWPDVSINEIDDAQGMVHVSASLPLGATEGIDGPYALATIEFSIDAIGLSILNIDETYTPLLITPDVTEIPVTVVDGLFANVPPEWMANLAGRSAWPEHHHFVMAKDGNPAVADSHGTPGLQTLHAKVKNLGNILTTVHVVFTVTHKDDLWSKDFTTDPVDLPVGDPAVLTYNVDPDEDLVHGDPPHYLGKYSIEARCYYTGEGGVTLPGVKLKITGFSLVSG